MIMIMFLAARSFSEARDSRNAHYIACMAFGCIALSGIWILLGSGMF